MNDLSAAFLIVLVGFGGATVCFLVGTVTDFLTRKSQRRAHKREPF
jgi:hypothetical protein